MALVAIALVVWCVVTLVLAQWLPKLRATGKPTPPLFWMAWVPWSWPRSGGWLALVFSFTGRCWWKRGWRSPLGFTWLGLAASAALAIALTAAQLLPVIEFTQRTVAGRRRGARTTSIRSASSRSGCSRWSGPISWERSSTGNNYWGEMIQIPGARPKAWVPSLYLGGLTFVLALSSLTLRHGPPWRVWFTVIVVVSLLGSLGQYTSPIWVARVLAETYEVGRCLQRLLPDLGPIDPVDDTPIRHDGYLRDGDGSFYWWLTQLLPGFRQFRFPAKLFTFTAPGSGGPCRRGLGPCCRRAGPRRSGTVLRAPGLDPGRTGGSGLRAGGDPRRRFATIESQSMMGPFDPDGGYQVIIRSLGQAAIVFGLGLVLTIVARKRPHLAGSAALIVMTADLAAANARYVLTVPQSVFETKPEVLKIIEDAERAHPSPGPYRIHRMPLWNPLGWYNDGVEGSGLRDRLMGARHDPAQVWNQPGSRVHPHARGRRAL